jgi:hypothetical protein
MFCAILYINIVGHTYNQEMHLLKFGSYFVLKREMCHAAYFCIQTSTRLQWHMPIGSLEKSTTQQYLTYTSERTPFKESLPFLLAWRSASNFLRTFIILIVVSAAQCVCVCVSPLFSAVTVHASGQSSEQCPCHWEWETAVQCNLCVCCCIWSLFMLIRPNMNYYNVANPNLFPILFMVTILKTNNLFVLMEVVTILKIYTWVSPNYFFFLFLLIYCSLI